MKNGWQGTHRCDDRSDISRNDHYQFPPLPAILAADTGFRPEHVSPSVTKSELRGCPQWVHASTTMKMKIDMDKLSIVIH